MNFLGIDYGKKKIGLATSEGKLAEPLRVIRYTDIKVLIEQIKQIVEKEEIKKIIVGISENNMGEESKSFASMIGAEIFDETLTSQDAISLSIQAGINRKKRKKREDAYAATIMLQNYLDSK
ncbi:hypothetical protein A2130_01745 [Candidatus Woesebacteria bacterium GWC2_33_12]|uniref:Putative pre-16S rRNA nuclease n=1 Tax=Candidatus Woesebacteria bacterium GW2011_GWB1_33_22 TaxID=1618566 RepID=A0A0G0CNF5_9BACT|nr:MAG: hypothetical protein UR29_C0007G0067 [Candidatus Woesebacteria bacterium GW2011_GWC2_33_12]KKP42203.1 MAG: hypothetical protein UR33_C0005G0067 [Candidatus Woesebacteria bacterium GW2011_GWA2_33_20]KKP44937.1 MAG: hypothetical protein UR35_C0005G0067 [Candidatus Woesebacteria bacterium GW2011_GWB1_33_22]KKP46751.1 MAG: hypothetical protein UR37_C0005G0067 [Microgenomates group bacterium GW2011_GWC1_33_28]KKP50651.1 MAG: hypothetical protein UR41_C0005G0067 [Candidatus Woesebacteria bact